MIKLMFCSFLYSEYTMKNGQDFLDIQYIVWYLQLFHWVTLLSIYFGQICLSALKQRKLVNIKLFCTEVKGYHRQIRIEYCNKDSIFKKIRLIHLVTAGSATLDLRFTAHKITFALSMFLIKFKWTSHTTHITDRTGVPGYDSFFVHLSLKGIFSIGFYLLRQNLLDQNYRHTYPFLKRNLLWIFGYFP